MREAHTYVQEMEERKIALHPYVDAAVLEAVYKAVGAGRGGGGGGGGGGRGPAAAAADSGSTAGSADRLVLGEEGEEEEEEVMDEDIDEVRYLWGVIFIVSCLDWEDR